MKLYGTTTSPFVRRVRAVAHEVGRAYETVDTATEAGLVELRAISPIRKVPVAVCDTTLIYDSRAIIDWLTGVHGYGGLSSTRDRWAEQNLVNAIDAALDAVIQLFYLRRDGVAVDNSPYAIRQMDRADAIFAWLAKQDLSPAHLGVPEISLVCALDWMDFRQTYPTARAAGVEHIRTAWRERPSLAATRPHT